MALLALLVILLVAFLLIIERRRQAMKFIFWWLFWICVLLALVAGLDNLFFQPPVPGWFIAALCLASIAYLFYEVRPFRRKH